MSLSRGFKVLQKQGPRFSVLLESRYLEDGILLESGTIVTLCLAEKNEIRSDYTKGIDAYGCLGVMKFSDDVLGKKQSLYLVLVTACMPVGKLFDCEVFRITGASFFSLDNGSVDADSRCTDVKKLLSSGKFYFAWSSQSKNNIGSGYREILDLTVSLQNQGKRDEEQRFFWNHILHLHFKHFGADCKSWLFRVMCGGIDIRTVYVGAQQARAVIISRLSCERAGTRFNVRGVNDEGSVANFVESEQAIVIGNSVSSFMQVRGSIPLFWEQPGLNVGSHKVKMSRGFEASAPAYERHFTSIIENYGQSMVVNLLGSKEGENMLSKMFQSHHANSIFKDSIPMICFDYHAECKGKSDNLSKLKAKVWSKIEAFGSYTYKEDDQLRITQSGVVRVNCLDCLDRTNSTETYFGLSMVAKQLENLGLGNNKTLEDRFREAFKASWPITGDLISRMYAGTGALEGKTKLKDGARSMTRAIQNNFLDQNKQNAIDLLIRGKNSADVELAARSTNLLSGECLRAPVNVLRGMCDKYREYTAPLPVRIAIGTWNVNGGKHFRSIAYKDQTLDKWLLDPHGEQKASKKFYRAIYDFASEEEGDLSFFIDDVIDVTETLEDGEWMRGNCNGRSGIFPASYVTPSLPRYTALFDFTAQQEGDLEFYEGETIEVTEMAGEWWKGRVLRGEDISEQPEGSFPANFVEMCRKGSMEDSSNGTTAGDDAVDWNKAIDIYVIGFQEMVELSAGNIVNTSHSNQQAWGIELQKTISSNYKYVMITSEQLVGVCLYVFVRPIHAPHIRDVEVATVKTGMGGATGNKGGIGIRMQLYNSSLCFVCSHLAAGQGQVQDRNNDYAEICKKMVFSSNKSIFCHDYVFWCGDLNYRIDRPLDEVKQLVLNQEWERLRENDQLCVERAAGRVFHSFREGRTDFAPTYKYDLFSDDYDTSDKSRTPAWTDRVLWYRREWFTEQQKSPLVATKEQDWNDGNLLFYGRAELRTSDHRPVIAILDVDILHSNNDVLDNTFHEVVSAQGPQDASILVSLLEHGSGRENPLTGELVESLLAKLNDCGEVILTRHLKEKLLVIFSEGWMALQAVTLNNTTVNGQTVEVTLKTGGWEEEIEREIRQRMHSSSFNDSRMEEISGQGYDVAEYEYTDDGQYDDQGYGEEYDRYTEEHNHAHNYQSTPDVYQSETNEYEEAALESYASEDPGWACETDYAPPPVPSPPAPEIPQPPKKAAAPPRPSAAPNKKPPRPTTLPSMPAGPPPIPSTSPAMRPGPPVVSSKPPSRASPLVTPPMPLQPSSILVPEQAPLPVPKAKPRSGLPKRKAPAPPPGGAQKPSHLGDSRKGSSKPKAPPPPLPITPPKGPAARKKRDNEHTNTAFIHENHSAPSLLDLDPFGSSSTFGDPPLKPNSMRPTPAQKPQSLTYNSSFNSLNFDLVKPMPPQKPAAHSSANLFPVQFSEGPPVPVRSTNPNYKPMVPQKPLFASSTHPTISYVPLQPTQVPLKPQVVNGSNHRKSPNDPNNKPVNLFGVKPMTLGQFNTTPKDPWGTTGRVDTNSNDIPNSFSSDFTKLTFNS